ncbi:MAG: hypothetical protein EOP40_02470 [Rubrivivax sp.]|nr:MAG: hypothetical protein EOP40_02470 [Rubrivivax sp.]
MRDWWAPRWPEQLDFAGPRVRTAWWSWALLGLALLAALGLEHRVTALEEARAEVAAELKRLRRADQRQRLALAASGGMRRTPVGHITPAPALQGAAMQEAALLARQLAYPWAAVLQGLETESARQQVVLMGMSLEVSSGQQAVLRAQGAVRDDMAALRWAAGLPAGQLLGRQALASPFVAAQGPYGLKADVQAVWAASPVGPP